MQKIELETDSRTLRNLTAYIYIPEKLLSSLAYSLDLSTCWTCIHASMNHSIHLRVTGCTRYKFRYVQIVNSGCKSSVSSCSGGRSMYCPRRKFSISPYAHTAQELSTRKSHGYRWVSSFNTFQLAHRRRWKRELSCHCMFKMIYMLAQLKLELSSLWVQPARHVLFQFPPACISS